MNVPKKPTGMAPTGGKASPIQKSVVPNSMPKPTLPQPIAGTANKTATMPGARFAKITRPAPMNPRTPKI